MKRNRIKSLTPSLNKSKSTIRLTFPSFKSTLRTQTNHTSSSYFSNSHSHLNRKKFNRNMVEGASQSVLSTQRSRLPQYPIASSLLRKLKDSQSKNCSYRSVVANLHNKLDTSRVLKGVKIKQKIFDTLKKKKALKDRNLRQKGYQHPNKNKIFQVKLQRSMNNYQPFNTLQSRDSFKSTREKIKQRKKVFGSKANLSKEQIEQGRRKHSEIAEKSMKNLKLNSDHFIQDKYTRRVVFRLLNQTHQMEQMMKKEKSKRTYEKELDYSIMQGRSHARIVNGQRSHTHNY